jgi:hypothetical protein
LAELNMLTALRTENDVRIIDFIDTGHPALLRM